MEKRRLKAEREKREAEAAAAEALRIKEEEERQFVVSLMAMRLKQRFRTALQSGYTDLAKDAAACMIQCAWRSKIARFVLAEKRRLLAERLRIAAEAARVRAEAEHNYTAALKFHDSGDAQNCVVRGSY